MTDQNLAPKGAGGGFAEVPASTYLDSVMEARSAEANPSLKDFLTFLWQGKTTIALTTVVGLSLGILGYLLVAPETTARLELRPIPIVDFQSYEQLNALTDNNSASDSPAFEIGRFSLVALLVDELERRDSFIEAFRENGLFEGLDLNEQELEEELLTAAYSVELIPPDSAAELENIRNRDPKPFWTLTFTGVGKEKVLDSILMAIDQSNENLKQKLVKSFDQYVGRVELNSSNRLQDIERDIRLAITEYDLKIESRLAQLTEQSEIARVLEIAKNTLEARQFGNNDRIVTIAQESGPLFLRGYEALEKEIEQIKGRKNKIEFIPDLIDFQMTKLRIEQSPFLDRVKAAFAKTPLSQGQFRAAGYNRYAVETDTSLLNVGLLALLTMIGFILGVGWVATKFALK